MIDEGLKWYFSKSTNAGGRGVNDGLTDLFPGEPYANLIRESIQNSLDAHEEGNPNPVRVEYTIRDFLTAEFENLTSLREHIQMCADEFSTVPKFKNMLEHIAESALSVLEVADYNTTGMDYDLESDSGKFRKFVRYAGDPNSDDGAGGSHGYGKITYFSLSDIKTIFVSSMFHKDRRCTFEGVARLATHPTGTIRETYGDTGFFDLGNGDPIQELASETNPDGSYVFTSIPKEFQRNEPGTTVSILFSNARREGIDKVFKLCVEAVLRSFFATIEEGLLEVKIDFDLNHTIEINKSNIEEIFRERFFTSTEDTVKNNVFDRLNPHPYWLAYKHGSACTVPVDMSVEDAVAHCLGRSYLKIEGNLDILGKVSLYLYLSQFGNDVIIFARNPRMMVNVQKSRSTQKKGYSAVFVCEDEKGNKLLRRMEDAAHRTWSKSQLVRDNRSKEDVKEAENIEKEMRAFIEKCLDQIVFPVDNSDEEDIQLEDITMPIISDDESTNPLLGVLISKQGTDDNQKGAPVDINAGEGTSGTSKVFVGQAQTIEKKKVKKTTKKSGTTAGGSKSSSSGGGESTSGAQEFEEDNEGSFKLVRRKLKLNSYRVISDTNEDGSTDFTLIVNSPRDVEKAYLKLSPVGETADEGSIQIAQTSKGKVIENEISGISLKEGKNEILFSLSEEGEYTFTLSAEQDVKVKI